MKTKKTIEKLVARVSDLRAGMTELTERLDRWYRLGSETTDSLEIVTRADLTELTERLNRYRLESEAAVGNLGTVTRADVAALGERLTRAESEASTVRRQVEEAARESVYAPPLRPGRPFATYSSATSALSPRMCATSTLSPRR
jgi:hypothetical protein